MTDEQSAAGSQSAPRDEKTERDPGVLEALRELVAAKQAHEDLCERRRTANENKPLFDMRQTVSSIGLNCEPDPEFDAAIARINAAWAAARVALDAGKESK